MAQLSVEPNDKITYKVRYEDEHLLVVGKPPGIVSMPGKAHDYNSLLNGLFAVHGERLQNLGRTRDFGLLHRLDKNASGLLMVALTTKCYDAMREAFEARRVAKFYWALTRGAPNKPAGVINRPILEYAGRSDHGDDKRVKKLAKVAASGKPAVTAYRVLASSQVGALVECRAVTGRLHQVRVHLDSIGCAILGDDLYGPISGREVAPRLALHAHRIYFDHPITGARIDVRATWPPDLRATLKRVGLPRPENALPAAKKKEEVADELTGDLEGSSFAAE